MREFRDPHGQQWFEVESFPQTMDLSILARALSGYGIPHRIAEEGGSQVIWVARREDRDRVATAVDHWRRGELEVPDDGGPAPQEAGIATQAGLILRLLPITTALLALSVLGFLVVLTDPQLRIGHWFTIVDISRYATAGLPDLDPSEFWRLWTPMFLHFDLMHIVFNALFLWVFGARIERVMGSRHFLLFVAVIGVLSNLGQLGWENNPRFGGMSGVNYGFIGYIWLRQLLAPHPMLVFPKALIPMLLVMLLLGTFGVLDFFIQGRVANAAHVTGLLVGMTWGLLGGLYLGGGKGRSTRSN